MYDVKGRRAIITGGAQGFGREFGIRLVGAGCRVCLADLDEVKGEETKKEIQRRYNLTDDSVFFVKCNVAIPEDWTRLWDAAENALGGKIELLLNNAGINPSHGWEMNLEVMLVGATRGVFLAVERMSRLKGADGGRIINTASMAGLSVAALGDLNSSGYTIAKHGMVSLTRSFRSKVYHEEGIKCYTLAPWFADTNLVRSQLEKAKETNSPGFRGNRVTSMEELSKAVHTRILTVEEVGEAMMTSLKIDKNGAVYSIMPDSPLIEYPNYKTNYGYLVITMAKYIGGSLGLEHFGPIHFYSIFTLMVFFAYFVLSSILSLVF